MGGEQDESDTEGSSDRLSTACTIFLVVLLTVSAGFAGLGAGDSFAINVENVSSVPSNGVGNQPVADQDASTEIVQYFYESLQQLGVHVNVVCIEDDVVHIHMKETDQVTRFSDAEYVTDLYVLGATEAPEAFRAIDGVRMEWPADGRMEQRTMYISSQWVEEYQTGEINNTVLVGSVLFTEDNYSESYQPSTQAVCYPSSSPSNDGTNEIETTESSSENTDEPEVSDWYYVEGNETELRAAEDASPERIVADLLSAGLSVESYRTVDHENDSFDDLQVLLPPHDWETRQEQAKQAALIFAEARENGYNKTSRLHLMFAHQEGPVKSMFIRTTWVDKYLNGGWTDERYICQVMATDEVTVENRCDTPETTTSEPDAQADPELSVDSSDPDTVMRAIGGQFERDASGVTVLESEVDKYGPVMSYETGASTDSELQAEISIVADYYAAGVALSPDLRGIPVWVYNSEGSMIGSYEIDREWAEAYNSGTISHEEYIRRIVETWEDA